MICPSLEATNIFTLQETALWIDLLNIKSWWKTCRLGERQVIITEVYAMPEAPISLPPASTNTAMGLSSLNTHLFSTLSCPITYFFQFSIKKQTVSEGQQCRSYSVNSKTQNLRELRAQEKLKVNLTHHFNTMLDPWEPDWLSLGGKEQKKHSKIPPRFKLTPFSKLK